MTPFIKKLVQKQDLDSLVNLLKDSDYSIREEAAEALGW
jgi:HEAT repeat protein